MNERRCCAFLIELRIKMGFTIIVQTCKRTVSCLLAIGGTMHLKRCAHISKYPAHQVNADVDCEATAALFRRTSPRTTNAQNYLFKLRHHRIKCKANVIRDANKWGTNTVLSEHYQQDKCPM